MTSTDGLNRLLTESEQAYIDLDIKLTQYAFAMSLIRRLTNILVRYRNENRKL